MTRQLRKRVSRGEQVTDRNPRGCQMISGDVVAYHILDVGHVMYEMTMMMRHSVGCPDGLRKNFRPINSRSIRPLLVPVSPQVRLAPVIKR